MIRAYNKGSDSVSFTLSSNVTIDNVGVITRSYTNLTVAVWENAASRIFGGVSIPYLLFDMILIMFADYG